MDSCDEAKGLSEYFGVHAAETKGSGIRVMRELMRTHNLMPPTFDSSRHPDQFTVILLLHHLLDEQDLEWARSLTEEVLSPEDVRGLIFVRETGAIDNAAYREISGIDTLVASSRLRRLRDLHLLAKKGAGSKTYYIPGAAFKMSRSPEEVCPVRLDIHQVDADIHQVLADIPDQLVAQLPAPETRPRREVLHRLIVDLCRCKPMSAKELSYCLRRRDVKGLVRDYLKPMLSEGVLSYTIPQMHNHPEQKYKLPAPKLMEDKSSPG